MEIYRLLRPAQITLLPDRAEEMQLRMTFYEPLIGHVNEKWLSNFPNLPSVMFLKIFLKLIVDLIELFLEWLPD